MSGAQVGISTTMNRIGAPGVAGAILASSTVTTVIECPRRATVGHARFDQDEA
jgi:hypothetical protein